MLFLNRLFSAELCSVLTCLIKVCTNFTCPTEEELLSGRAPPGDEGVLEEVVNLAVRGVANALQSADVEYMGALKETGKLVAKTVCVVLLVPMMFVINRVFF